MSAINWFPGHMRKAQRELKERMGEVDCVLEVLDARLPGSTQNPLLAELVGDRPVVKVLSKADLADEAKTQKWLAHFKAQDQVAVAIRSQDYEQAQHLLPLVRHLLPGRGTAAKPIRMMVMGLPNVGKSTLLNTLAGKSLAKVGNEPAVTKGQQRIKLQEGLVIYDSPGVMWPKVADEASGYRLAMLGMIRDTAIDYPEVAHFAVEDLAEQYPKALMQRYKIPELSERPEENLEAIAKNRGLLKHGHLDWQRTAEILLHELRAGQLGTVTLEQPS